MSKHLSPAPPSPFFACLPGITLSPNTVHQEEAGSFTVQPPHTRKGLQVCSAGYNLISLLLYLSSGQQQSIQGSATVQGRQRKVDESRGMEQLPQPGVGVAAREVSILLTGSFITHN